MQYFAKFFSCKPSNFLVSQKCSCFIMSLGKAYWTHRVIKQKNSAATASSHSVHSKKKENKKKPVYFKPCSSHIFFSLQRQLLKWRLLLCRNVYSHYPSGKVHQRNTDNYLKNICGTQKIPQWHLTHPLWHCKLVLQVTAECVCKESRKCVLQTSPPKPWVCFCLSTKFHVTPHSSPCESQRVAAARFGWITLFSRKISWLKQRRKTRVISWQQMWKWRMEMFLHTNHG